jgi:hypothetical protein
MYQETTWDKIGAFLFCIALGSLFGAILLYGLMD